MHNLKIVHINFRKLNLFFTFSAPILMPTTATTILPTRSNVEQRERRQEVEDAPMASVDEDDPPVLTPMSENTNLVAVGKKRITAGTTAKALQQCQEEMREY